MKKPLPVLTSDEEAERFVAEADLAEYDLSVLKPTRFVLTAADREAVVVSVDSSALIRATERASAKAMPLDRYLGELLEQALSG